MRPRPYVLRKPAPSYLEGVQRDAKLEFNDVGLLRQGLDSVAGALPSPSPPLNMSE